MKLREIANAVGIGKYPEILEDIYASLPVADAPACDIALIDRLQQEYKIFDSYYALIRKTAQQINADRYRSTWIRVAVAYAKDRNVTDARKVPVPKADGTQITALLPLFVLLPQIPEGIASYRRRGFSEAQIQTLMMGYAGGIRIVEAQTGMPGINWLYYHWLNLYAKAMIFNTEGLQFEIRTLPDGAIFLKNQITGQILPLMTKGQFHRSGKQVVGSAGYEDADGAFEAMFREDDANYYGHCCAENRVDPKEKIFPKTVWKCVARPGDGCLSIHIPRNADISREKVASAIASAQKIAKEGYSECKSTAIYGSSWILDPTLATVLGPNSKITNFLEQFTKYPQKSDGKGVFGYVFPKTFTSYEELPENTSLQRKLKQHYLDGKFIYDFAGVIIL